jgi:trehalose 6-phosphate synthase/phosphatase
VTNLDWKKIALPVMEHYTDMTYGSWTEAKETSLVWHYEKADPKLGPCQAKELQDHLQSVLVNEPVCVKSGHQIVDVHPQVRELLILSRIISLLYIDKVFASTSALCHYFG